MKNPNWRSQAIKATIIPASSYYIQHSKHGYGLIAYVDGNQIDVCFENGELIIMDWGKEKNEFV